MTEEASGAKESSKAVAVDPQRLEHSMYSPLRLRLMAELSEAEGEALSLDDLVVGSGRHRQDVVACLAPLVHWGVVAELPDATYRLRRNAPTALRATIERVLRQRAEQIERDRHVRGRVLCGMIGVDAKMQLVFEMVRQVARIDVPVLITGETGTGKELVARAIHELSKRRDQRFGAVNCATLSETLFASELFGHVKGAFTGAVRSHVGLFERCDKGTVFLDEVADTPLSNQVKLLRVLQEGTFMRVGGERLRQSGFRLISATNRNLREMIRSGAFREDLYYRLNVFPIRVPSLRERLDDIPHLVDEILRAQMERTSDARFPVAMTEAALQRLRAHTWPGNVRELENVVIRASIMAREGVVDVVHLPELAKTRTATPPVGEVRPVLRSLADVEQEHIRAVLRELGGNMTAAADVLGISRTTLYRRVVKYGLDMESEDLR
jgi:DNA-binding NtrC family response regulator